MGTTRNLKGKRDMLTLDVTEMKNGSYSGPAVRVKAIQLPLAIKEALRQIMAAARHIGAEVYRRRSHRFAVHFGGVGGRLYTVGSLLAALRRVVLKECFGNILILMVGGRKLAVGLLIGWSGSSGDRVIIRGELLEFGRDGTLRPSQCGPRFQVRTCKIYGMAEAAK